MTIPQVKERETEIKLVADNPDYLDGASLEELERIRMTLRDLIRFIADSTARKMVITDLKDPVIDDRKDRNSTQPSITKTTSRSSTDTSTSTATMRSSVNSTTTSHFPARTSRTLKTS